MSTNQKPLVLVFSASDAKAFAESLQRHSPLIQVEQAGEQSAPDDVCNTLLANKERGGAVVIAWQDNLDFFYGRELINKVRENPDLSGFKIVVTGPDSGERARHMKADSGMNDRPRHMAQQIHQLITDPAPRN
jgi:hypothetical protein